MTASHRRWFAISLRTLFVLVAICAIGTAQWMRIQKLQKRASEHRLMSVGYSWEVGIIHGEAFQPHHPRHALKAYWRRRADYHATIAAKCRQSIWQPWVELPHELKELAKREDSRATQADRP